jgi:hypothetical protein
LGVVSEFCEFKKGKAMAFKFVSLVLMSASALAQPADADFVLSGVPKKAVCKSTNYEAGAASRKVEFCLTQGMFSPDVYEIKIDRKLVIRGTDDQTTVGLQGKEDNRTWSLRCLPIEAKPNITADELKILEPQYPQSKVAEIVDLSKGAKSSMEISRRCTVLADEQRVITATVLF